jgi:hypothetical protein
MKNWNLIFVLLMGSMATGCWQSAPETPMARGKAFFEAGEWDQAIAALDEAIVRNPLDAEAHLFRGQSYMCRGREYVGRALADYNEAIRLDPKNYEAYYHRAIAYRERGEKQKALADDLIARRLDPNAEKAALMRSAPTPEEYKAAFEHAAEVEKSGGEGEINDALLETVPDFKPSAARPKEPVASASDREADLTDTKLPGRETAQGELQDAYGLPVPDTRSKSVTEKMLGIGSEKPDREEDREFRPRAPSRRRQAAPDWQVESSPLPQQNPPAAQQPERRSTPVGTLPFGNPYLPRSNAYSPYPTGPRSTGIRSNEPVPFDPNVRGGLPYYGSRRYDPNAVQQLPRRPGAQPPLVPPR